MRSGFRFRYFVDRKSGVPFGPVIFVAHEEESLSVLVANLKSFFVACGYHPDTVKQAFVEAAEEGEE
jgi:hypothetical protein